MKKTIKRLLLTVIAVLVLCNAVACDKGTTSGGSATGSSDITVSEPVFGFISEDEYDPATSVIDTSKKWTSLDVDASYYLFLSFDITAARDNDGQSLLDLNITFDALNVMDGTIEDVSTGMIESMIFNDAETGNIGKTTTASFKIPALSAEPKTIKMIVKLKPVDVGESHIIIGYDYDETGEYKILGSDGYTKNLKINQVQIEAPVLSVTDMGMLSWKHVKNAEYYMVYENGNAVKDIYGKDIVIAAEGYAVGSEMQYSIGNDVVGFHNLSIRAFSSNKNILTSSYSNAVSHTW
ncbi:MAG: hypothetical protein IJZ80_09500 [Clostridia bacterium]|nr:hypothetical protein [Clostridia bacterium]